jgi:glycosyltransferase involved in cell wall biosynthesis
VVQSLFIVSLPRSLTTLAIRVSTHALKLRLPAWTTDGEILNADYVPFHAPSSEQAERFLPKWKDPATYERWGAFLRDVVSPHGVAYKDVVQPFLVADEVPLLGIKHLVIRRPLADVAMAMAERGWDYSRTAASVYTDDRAAIEGLIRAAAALAQIPGETVDYLDMLQTETSLTAALGSLYPGVALGPVRYVDGQFRRDTQRILQRMHSPEHRLLEARVHEVAEGIGVEIPEGWAAPATRKHRRATASSTRPTGKPTLLVVGDAVAPTGFARVTRSLISRWGGRFHCHQLGVNYSGDPHRETWPIYPASLGGDAHGVNRLPELAAKLRPDIILFVNDMWIIADYLERLATADHRSRLVAYIPVDGEPLPPALVARLAPLDRVVVYNSFGARILQDAEKTIQAAQPAFGLPPLDIIPHGVDTAVFRPLFPLGPGVPNRRRAVRAALLGDGASWDDSFIVLNANRNQPRKRIDVTVAGFAQFAAGKPSSVKLYLHMGAVDQGWDIRRLVERHGISDRVLMSCDGAGPPNLTVDQLNQVYNACDVGLNTAEGEGWGLPSFEHAATAAAQIVPGHSGPGSIWNGHAEMLEPSLRVTTPGLQTDAQLIAPATVAVTLEELYRNEDLLFSLSTAAYKLATNPAHRWDSIADRFGQLLEDTTSKPGPQIDPDAFLSDCGPE